MDNLQTEYQQLQVRKYLAERKMPKGTSDLIHGILTSEDARLEMAMEMFDTTKEIADFLGKSERTVFRRLQELNKDYN